MPEDFNGVDDEQIWADATQGAGTVIKRGQVPVDVAPMAHRAGQEDFGLFHGFHTANLGRELGNFNIVAK